LVAWAAVTREPQSELVQRPPFSQAEAPEAIGTAVGFHYVNRIVEVFQGHGRISVGPLPLRGLTMTLVGWIAARALRRRRAPGRTLHLLAEAELPADLSWASASSHISSAWARFAAAVERCGEAALPEPARACVTSALAAWDGTDPPLGSDWLQRAVSGIDLESAPAARLALLVALAPYRVDDAAVNDFKRIRPSERELVAAAAWSSFRAARRIGCWLDPSERATVTPAGNGAV
jgi:hypothetical protein